MLVTYVLVWVWVEVVEVIYVTYGWVAECACTVCISFLCPYLWYENVCRVWVRICDVHMCGTHHAVVYIWCLCYMHVYMYIMCVLCLWGVCCVILNT